MRLKWRKRCSRCLQYLRDNGTCQNPKCVRYTPEDSTTTADSEKTAKDSTAGTTENA